MSLYFYAKLKSDNQTVVNILRAADTRTYSRRKGAFQPGVKVQKLQTQLWRKTQVRTT